MNTLTIKELRKEIETKNLEIQRIHNNLMATTFSVSTLTDDYQTLKKGNAATVRELKEEITSLHEQLTSRETEVVCVDNIITISLNAGTADNTTSSCISPY